MSSTGVQVRSARRAAGLTLVEMARRSGYSAGYLSDVERGRRPVSKPALHVIRQVLGAGIDACCCKCGRPL